MLKKSLYFNESTIKRKVRLIDHETKLAKPSAYENNSLLDFF